MRYARLAAVPLVAVLLAACGAASRHTAQRSGDIASPSVRVLPSSSAPVRSAAAPVAAAPAESTPTPADHCAGNAAPKAVLVDLSAQHLWMCARHRTIRDTAVTSGMLGEYTETPTGHYRIQSRNTNTTLTLNTGATYAVKYWIPFDAPLFGFHDSPWQRFPYGSPRYRTDGSHGCVHMPLAAIRFLYRWGDVGTPVTIRH